jgi:hypothetical protein
MTIRSLCSGHDSVMGSASMRFEFRRKEKVEREQGFATKWRTRATNWHFTAFGRCRRLDPFSILSCPSEGVIVLVLNALRYVSNAASIACMSSWARRSRRLLHLRRLAFLGLAAAA